MEAADDETTLARGLQNPPPPKSGSIPPLKDLVGQQFADYRLDEIITMGHSGMVFRGTDVVNNRVITYPSELLDCLNEIGKNRNVDADMRYNH